MFGNEDLPGTQRHETTMNRKVQRQNDLASFLAYLKFCRLHPAYYPGWANQFRIFDWIDERRIEMLAEGRPHWVPSTHDFEQAMRQNMLTTPRATSCQFLCVARCYSLVFSGDHCPSRVVADRETHGNWVREPCEVNTACFGAYPERATPERPNVKLTLYTRDGPLEIPSAILACTERTRRYGNRECSQL